MHLVEIILAAAVFAAGASGLGYGFRRSRKVDQLGDAWVIIKPVGGKVRFQIDNVSGTGPYVDLTTDRAKLVAADLLETIAADIAQSQQ